MTGSVKTSPHLSKDRLVVIIVDFLPVLIDKLVNSNSAPSLSDVNDNITMNREWKIKMYKNDH